MKRNILIGMLATAVFAVPVLGAQAKPPTTPPKPNPPKSHRCDKSPRAGFVARGSYVSFTATSDLSDDPSNGDLTVNVTKTNKHARSYLGQQTFSTIGAKVSFKGVTDSNSDGSVGFDDALTTDRVMLIGKITKPKRGCTGDQTVTVRKIKVSRRAA